MECNPTLHIFLNMAKLGVLGYGNPEILSEIHQDAQILDFLIKFTTDTAANVIFVASMLSIWDIKQI